MQLDAIVLFIPLMEVDQDFNGSATLRIGFFKRSVHIIILFKKVIAERTLIERNNTISVIIAHFRRTLGFISLSQNTEQLTPRKNHG